MRWTPAALLLLAACRSAHDPESIQRALAKTPIDVATLEEAFRVEPRALRIQAPVYPAITLSPPREPWIIENASSRPVWLRRASLRVGVEHEPFLPSSLPYGKRYGGKKGPPLPRPDFIPEDWILLPPSGRTSLAFESSAWPPGDLALSASVSPAGAYLVHQARQFNEKTPRSFDESALAVHQALTLILPPADYPGSPWHADHALDPAPLKDGRFEWTAPHPSDHTFAAMELEAFLRAGERVERVAMKAEAFDRASGRARYALPAPLPLGDYRILFRAPDAAGYFLGITSHKCDASDGAASRWIPFRIE